MGSSWGEALARAHFGHAALQSAPTKMHGCRGPSGVRVRLVGQVGWGCGWLSNLVEADRVLGMPPKACPELSLFWMGRGCLK